MTSTCSPPYLSAWGGRSSKTHFESFGFKNILDSKKAALSKLDSIPQGAIFILNKKANSGCPVSQPYGHVAARCGDNQLYWGWGQNKSLSKFVKAYPECITAIMVHPSWKTAVASSLPTTPPLPPEREKVER